MRCPPSGRSRILLLGLFAAVRLCPVFAADAAATSAAAPAGRDLPGSAGLPPRALHSPEPPPLLNEAIAGATVGLWLKPDGTVETAEFIRGTQSWKEAVLEAVREWKFEPVQFEGKAIPARVVVGFTMQRSKDILVDYTSLPNLPGEMHSQKEWGLTLPTPLDNPPISVPLKLRGSSAPSAVNLSFVIGPDGTTSGVEVQSASSEAAVRAGLDVVGALRFTPGKVRDDAVSVEMSQQLTFVWENDLVPAVEGGIDICEPVFPFERMFGEQEAHAKVRFRLNEKGAPEKPDIIEASCPEHPEFNASLAAAIRGWMATERAKLKPGQEHVQTFAWKETPMGKATVKFHLAADGTVDSSEIVAASHPDYGAALRAAIDSWAFGRDAAAMKPDREYAHFFVLEEASHSLRRFAFAARKGELPNQSKGLDAKPAMVARATLTYPRALFADGVEGSAMIEFSVDRTGLVQLPRVIEATHPEFGWAAATWVNSWRFKPLTRSGQPAEVRIRQVVKFSQPKKQG